MARTETVRTQSESALEDVREEFRKRLASNEEERKCLVDRLKESLLDPQYSNFFRAWVNGLLDNTDAHTNEEKDARVGKALEALARRLESDREYEPSELLALLRLDVSHDATPGTPSEWLPSLVGFSLMRVSHHYNEIYYADIVSELLPQSVREFIKGSVSVPRRGGMWAGSVGRAIQDGEELVPSSLLDPEGEVACEDLIGGNISILMRSVYKDRGLTEHDPEKVTAVVFCFLPLPGVFKTDADSKVLRIFADAVNDRAYSIRAYCEQKDSAGSGARLSRLMRQHHALTERSDIGTGLVGAIVTPDTQNNPVGAVMGTYFDVKGGDATINSVVICERYLERQEWFPEFLVGRVKDKFAQILPVDLTEEKWGHINLVFKDAGAAVSAGLKLPESLRLRFASLWKVFESCPAPVTRADLSYRDKAKSELAEKVKIAGDIIRALLDQVMYFVALYVTGEEGTNQVADNIKQILNLSKAYGDGMEHGAALTPGWSEKFEADLYRWAGEVRERYGSKLVVIVGYLDKQAGASLGPNAADFWNEWRRARICSANWQQWLNNLFGADAKISVPLAELKGTGDCYAALLPDFCRTLKDQLRIVDSLIIKLPSEPAPTSGVLRISSLEPLVYYARRQEYSDSVNPILGLVASFFESILRGKKEADAEREVTLARFARGASHGFKNALAVPDLVLGKQVEEMRKGLIQMELSERDNKNLRRLVEATTFVKEEARYLKEQAELFFWVMDDEKAREDIAKRASQKDEKPSLRTAVYKAFLRGLFLSVRNRLSNSDLMSVLSPSNNGGANDPGELRKLLGVALIDANNDNINDALNGVKQYLSSNSSLSLQMPEIFEDGGLQMNSVTGFVVDAVLMELFQNATKAAIVSARELAKSGKQSFIKVSVAAADGGDIISVTNSACDADLKRLEDANAIALMDSHRGVRASADGGGGIKGIWQVRMLCDSLSGGALLLSDKPLISENSVTYTLTHRPVN
jgi:hypothetical protein